MMINEVFSTSTPVVVGICRFSLLINLRANEVSTSCQHAARGGVEMGMGMGMAKLQDV